MMINEHDAELLSAYMDDNLDADERATLEQRLAAEPALQRELSALRQTVGLIQNLPTLKAPRNFTLTPEQVAPPGSIMPLRRRRDWRPFAGLVAAVVVVAMGLVAVISNSPQPNQSQPVAAAPTQAATPAYSPQSRIFSNVIIADEAMPDVGAGAGAAPPVPEALEAFPAIAPEIEAPAPENEMTTTNGMMSEDDAEAIRQPPTVALQATVSMFDDAPPNARNQSLPMMSPPATPNSDVARGAAMTGADTSVVPEDADETAQSEAASAMLTGDSVPDARRALLDASETLRDVVLVLVLQIIAAVLS